MRLPILIKSLLVTFLALGLSMVLMQPFSASTAALFSSPEKNDFTITDFYNLVADSRAVSRLDDNIVIVNLDNSDRAEIASLLDMISLCGPKAVGLDVTFADQRPDDEILLGAIEATPGLVLPLTLSPTNAAADTFAITEASYFYAPGSSDTEFASSALPSKYAGSTIREFCTSFTLSDGQSVPSFAAALARKASPKDAQTLEARGNSLETINYHSRRFRTYEPSELIDHAQELHGRVVLMGALHERGDLHPTPVNSMMPGVMIHAHALATILDADYMTVPPKAVHWLMAFALCFLVVFCCQIVTGQIKGLLLRILQISLLYAVVQLGYYLFVRHGIILDFSNALLMLTFGLFACDVWNGLAAIASWCIARGRALATSPLIAFARRGKTISENSSNPS